MNQATQQISPDPARDFANAVLAETDNAREIIDMLHDIAQGIHEDATDHDCISASRILLDRGLGKCPRQSPATNPDPEHSPATDDNDVGALREAPTLGESPSAVPHKEPESPRLVTQIGDALHESLGPVPKACTEPVAEARSEQAEPEDSVTPVPFNPFSIQSDIQKYILEITNNGLTIISALTDIYRAYDSPEDYPERRRKVKHYHRVTAGIMLLDRVLGIYPTLVLGQVERSDLSAVDGANTPSDTTDSTEKETVPDPKWLETLAEIKRMEDEGEIPTVEFDPFAPQYKWATEEEVRPYADEVAAAFRAELELQAERRAMWPEIEERRRKKLAQIYPSHSEDEPQDT